MKLKFNNIYGKLVTASSVHGKAEEGKCLRCHGNYKKVLLLNNREAYFCPSCFITMPMPSKEKQDE